MKVIRRIWFGEELHEEAKEELLLELQQMGRLFGFMPVRQNEEPSEVCLFNIPLSDVLHVFLNRRLRRLPRFAIITEPSIVLPYLKWSIWNRFFSCIFWLGKPLSSGPIYRKPHVFIDEIDFPQVDGRNEAAVIVSRNKVSMTKGEMYTLRRQVIHGLDNLHVFGSGWSEPKGTRVFRAIKESVIALATPGRFTFGVRRLFVMPKNYEGQVSDKHATLAKYRVVLAIENCQENLTEKLLDAWMAGCIPVYVGPTLSEFDIPDGLAIECGDSFEEVEVGLARALAMNHHEFSERLKRWLFEESTLSVWSWEPAWKRIFDVEISRSNHGGSLN